MKTPCCFPFFQLPSRIFPFGNVWYPAPCCLALFHPPVKTSPLAKKQDPSPSLKSSLNCPIYLSPALGPAVHQNCPNPSYKVQIRLLLTPFNPPSSQARTGLCIGYHWCTGTVRDHSCGHPPSLLCTCPHLATSSLLTIGNMIIQNLAQRFFFTPPFPSIFPRTMSPAQRRPLLHSSSPWPCLKGKVSFQLILLCWVISVLC